MQEFLAALGGTVLIVLGFSIVSFVVYKTVEAYVDYRRLQSTVESLEKHIREMPDFAVDMVTVMNSINQIVDVVNEHIEILTEVNIAVDELELTVYGKEEEITEQGEQENVEPESN